MNELFDQIIRITFSGFAVYIFIEGIARLFRNRNEGVFKPEVKVSAHWLLRVVSLFWIIIFVWGLRGNFGDGAYMLSWERIWNGMWVFLLAYAILPQLLWFKKIRNCYGCQLLMAVAMFFAVFIEPFIIILTSFHQDYLEGDIGPTVISYGLSFLLSPLMNVAIFALMLLIVHWLRNLWIKKYRTDPINPPL